MNIFIAFANQDRDVRDKLLRQMSLVKDRLGWNIWSAKEIKALLLLWIATMMSSCSTTPNLPRKSGFEMVAVSGGTFQMGSPSGEEGRAENECQHLMSVGSFSLGKYEVTQADWRETMGKTPSKLSGKGCNECPVWGVSWSDLQDFLKKINIKDPGKNYRLPTEAEWEYAAKGGNASNKTKYSGSDDLSLVAWYFDNAYNRPAGRRSSVSYTHPIGSKLPNELGLYDMSGNVWEWCQDTYSPYPCDSKTAANGRLHMVRGGSAFYYARYCRTANRECRGFIYRHAGTADRDSNLGFRLCSVSMQ